MECVAGLRFSPLPNIPSLRIPSCLHSARATKPQLSLSHSFLSVPRTFEGRPLHRPVSCKPYGSRHRGAENVPLTAFFPWTLGRIHCWKRKAGETGMGSTPNQPGAGEGHQIQQIQDAVKCLQLCCRDGDSATEMLKEYLRLMVVEKDPNRANAKLDEYIMTVAKELQTVGKGDMAVKLLKAYAPLAATNYGEQGLQLVERELMKCLHAQGKYGEAFQYWLQLYNKKSPYLKTIPKQLQSDLLRRELSGDAGEAYESLKDEQGGSGDIPESPPN